MVTHITFVVAIEGGGKSLSEFVARRSHFEQIRELDSARYSAASLARDTQTGETVVVKILHTKPSDEGNRRMFEREVEILASVDHPTVLEFRSFVPIDIDTDERRAIVTKFGPRGSFQKVIDAERAPDGWEGTQKLVILFGIAYGMMTLHRRGIIHRDLKPDNVLLNGELEPEFADFGMSKSIETGGSLIQTADFGTASIGRPRFPEATRTMYMTCLSMFTLMGSLFT